MAGQLSGKRAFARNYYWNGVFTGVFLGVFLLTAILLIFIRTQGLKLAINPEILAGMVQMKIQSQAGQDIPEMLEGLKQELPNKIAGHLDELADLSISFGMSEVKLPSEVLAAIKNEFDRIMQEAILNTINDYDIKKYQRRIGENAYETVLKIVKQEMIGKTYLVKTSRWLSVPVKIVGSTNENLRIGI